MILSSAKVGQRAGGGQRAQDRHQQDGLQVHGEHQLLLGGLPQVRRAQPGTLPDGRPVGEAEPQLRRHLPAGSRSQGNFLTVSGPPSHGPTSPTAPLVELV